MDATFDTDLVTPEINQEYQYMLLSRLKMDNEYFLGYGNGLEKNLWAGNVPGQIAEMRRLYDVLVVKPEWLTLEQIDEYETKMTDLLASQS